MWNLIKIYIRNFTYKNNLRSTINSLIKKQNNLSSLQTHLTIKSGTLDSALKNAQLKSDKDSILVYQNELCNIKEIQKRIKDGELAIIQAIHRIEMLDVLRSASGYLENAIRDYKSLESSLLIFMPKIDNITKELTDLVNDSMDLSYLDNQSSLSLDSIESKQIIEPIKLNLESSSDKTFESLVKNNQITTIGNGKYEISNDKEMKPVKNFQIDTLKLNQHDIELKIHKYVKANYGKFDVLDAATNLGLPVELVETIALKLINQGKIQKVL